MKPTCYLLALLFLVCYFLPAVITACLHLLQPCSLNNIYIKFFSLVSLTKRAEFQFHLFYLGIRAHIQGLNFSSLSHFLLVSLDPNMASTLTQSSSSSGSIGSGQSSTMAPIPSYQMLNHTLPVKLDRMNYILWRS